MSKSRSPKPKLNPVIDSGAQSPALDRALALLEFISAHSEGVTTADIRTGLGFSVNLVFRLTKALMAHGYVERDELTRKYALTRKLLTLAQPKREERSLVQVAYEPLRRLRDVTGESAHIGIRVGIEALVLDRVVGTHPFKCYVEAGARGPLHTGAPGKAFLAWLPDQERDAILREMTFTRFTATTLCSRSAFASHLKLVRERGYAMDLGECLEGHHCLGAPVFDAEGRVTACVWITALAPRLSEKDGARLACHVIKAAYEISQALA